jgi:hypothetical protein
MALPTDVFSTRSANPSSPYFNSNNSVSLVEGNNSASTVTTTASASASPGRKAVGCACAMAPILGGFLSVLLNLRFLLNGQPVVSLPVILSQIFPGGMTPLVNPGIASLLLFVTDDVGDIPFTAATPYFISFQFNFQKVSQDLIIFAQTFEPNFEFDQVQFSVTVNGDTPDTGSIDWEIRCGVGVISV